MYFINLLILICCIVSAMATSSMPSGAPQPPPVVAAKANRYYSSSESSFPLLGSSISDLSITPSISLSQTKLYAMGELIKFLSTL